jgi:hypothetical protein
VSFTDGAGGGFAGALCLPVTAEHAASAPGTARPSASTLNAWRRVTDGRADGSRAGLTYIKDTERAAAR